MLNFGPERLRKYRWNEVSFVFQSAMNALNPVMRVSAQIIDTIRAHQPRATKDQVRARAVEMFDLAGISARRLDDYPHQFSGGMRQRIGIAIAMCLNPRLIILDEPTTALDVVVQRDIIEQICGLKNRLGFSVLNRSVQRAVSDVSLALHAGSALALVGDSGSGKSTIARILARLYRPSAGTITKAGHDIASLTRPEIVAYRRAVQMIFQDPFSSLNPTSTVGYHLERAIRLHRPGLSKPEVTDHIDALLTQVGLVPARSFAERRPHEISGGQRQRVSIARALSVEPSVILADEPTSMLDVSVRLGILTLLADEKDQRNLAALYITHDIATTCCPRATAICADQMPGPTRLGPDHFVRCHNL